MAGESLTFITDILTQIITNAMLEPIITNTIVEPIITNTIVEPIITNTIVEPIISSTVIAQNNLEVDKVRYVGLALENQFIATMIPNCENFSAHMGEFSRLSCRILNTILQRNPLVYTPIIENWTIASTLEFRQQIVHPITDESLRERWLFETIFLMMSIASESSDSIASYGDSLGELYELNKSILKTLKK